MDIVYLGFRKTFSIVASRTLIAIQTRYGQGRCPESLQKGVRTAQKLELWTGEKKKINLK